MTDHTITLTVNSTEHKINVESRELLVHVIRDKLGYTGTNIGCESSLCGACTLLLDGDAVKSCTVLAVQADGSTVRTVEDIANGNELHPIQQGFQEEHGLQCGYCTPGMMVTALDLLRDNPDPTRAEVREGLEGNLCRCTGYQNIVNAVINAADASGAELMSDGGTPQSGSSGGELHEH